MYARKEKQNYVKGERVRYILGKFAGEFGRVSTRQYASTEAYIVRLESSGEHIVSAAYSFSRMQEREDLVYDKERKRHES